MFLFDGPCWAIIEFQNVESYHIRQPSMITIEINIFLCQHKLLSIKYVSILLSFLQVMVLRDTGRLFLNQKYRPALMSGATQQMDEAQMAQTVDIPAYRAELVKLSEHYQVI